jgi:hypothetical protein
VLQRDQSHIADVIREQRFRLQGLRAGTQGDTREEFDSIARRMLDVESFLERDLQHRRRFSPSGISSNLRRIRSPRIGILVQHPPRALTLPKRYWRNALPDPAPSISIVTPSYEQGRFIERTLFSVLGQCYPDLEYVVQDGGSTDGTPAVLQRYAAELSHSESAPDGGQADALNRGFARTSGEIMGYINSDDLLLPGSLAYVARYFAAHPRVDVVYGNRVQIDSGDRAVGLWMLPPHDDALLTFVDYIPQETLFWRRRIWDSIGGAFDTTLDFANDWDLLIRFRECGATFARLPRFLGAFRVHDAQKTQLEQKLCTAECDLLRLRVHGRQMSSSEAVARMEPYYRRHVRAHNRQRVLDRLPIPRTQVRTLPPNTRQSTLPSRPTGQGHGTNSIGATANNSTANQILLSSESKP